MLNQLYSPFRHWSEKGTIWCYSDPHFSDEEMKSLRKNYISDDEQIAHIRSKVGKCDTLIILGDVGNPECISKLRGYKILIKGNHDAGSSKYQEYFDEIYEGPLFISEKVLLSHEPIDLPFAFNIHGHDHANWLSGEHHLNLCAEHIDYTPFNLTQFISKGGTSKVETIHRATIDKATKRKQQKI